MPAQEELIKDAEFYLEDVYEGLLALDRLLQLVKGENHSPLSRGQVINTAFYVSSRVADGLDDLRAVKHVLADERVAQLETYAARYKKQQHQVHRLKSGLGPT